MDVLVASGLFVLVMVMVVLALRMGRAALAKTDVHAETFRTAVTATDFVRQELRDARVESSGDVLVYRRSVRTGDVPGVRATGELELAETTTVMQVLTTGELVRVDGATGQRRVVGRLGQGGSARFDLLDGNLLRVTIRAVVPDAARPGEMLSQHEVRSEIFLGNQP